MAKDVVFKDGPVKLSYGSGDTFVFKAGPLHATGDFNDTATGYAGSFDAKLGPAHADGSYTYNAITGDLSVDFTDATFHHQSVDIPSFTVNADLFGFHF
ncbi:hypothetical protein [Methylobacterium sp. WSM2598]|uniref:hypothetical protein n=1 Tax=Methylobacterium sp. WSM2598 TaxID=398261 RepID=UPI000373174D|nr:hypothetical protein [Methylobacterium sp. WSM2598]